MTGGRRPTAATRVFALLGDPVSHSLSPLLQNAALAHLGLDGVYVALRCSAAHAPGLVASLACAGGGGNVTVPHKATVLAALDRTTEAVVRTGACNTFWGEEGVVCGDNTDVHGFRAAFTTGMRDPAGARVLLLGAGGAARAVLAALLADRVDRVVVYNRTPQKAAELVARTDDPRLRVADSVDGLDIDVVINATSLGLRSGDPLPIDLERLRRVGGVFDLVYRPEGTALVRTAHSRGIPAVDGTGMLVHQGAAAFARWWGREAPIDVMRHAVTQAGP